MKGFSEECNVEVKAFKEFLLTNKSLSTATKQSLESILEFIPYINGIPQKNNYFKKKLIKSIEDSGINLFKDWLKDKINGL